MNKNFTLSYVKLQLTNNFPINFNTCEIRKNKSNFLLLFCTVSVQRRLVLRHHSSRDLKEKSILTSQSAQYRYQVF